MPTRPFRPVRVAVANDYAIIVAGLARLLAEFPDRVQVVELAVREPVRSLVDIILVDTFATANRDGVGVARLVAAAGEAKVVLFGWGPAGPAEKHAAYLGAETYLSKTLDAHELVAWIEAIHQGLPTGRGTRSFGDEEPAQSHPWPGQAAGLSPREAEVIGLIAQGMSNNEIAGATYLGLNTIKTYVRTGYHKIGVTSRTQAVLWALANDFTRND